MWDHPDDRSAPTHRGASILTIPAILVVMLALLGCPRPTHEGPPLVDAGIEGTVSYFGGTLEIRLVSGRTPDALFLVDPFHGIRPGVDVPTAEKRLGVTASRSSTKGSVTYVLQLPDTRLQFGDLGKGNWCWESRPVASPLPLSSLFRYRLSERLPLDSYGTILVRGDYEVILVQHGGAVSRAIAF